MTSHSPARIAIGELFTECNHFVATTLGDADFERSRCWRGAAVAGITGGTLGAMLEVLRAEGLAVAPLVAASSLCGGPIQEATYQRLKAQMLADLRAALPVAGVLMSMHGSATAVETGDVEGELLAAIRALVGPDVPVVATLDLHAHVTARMVQAADALIGYETYPHRDTAETGTRGAQLLAAMVAGRVRPTMAMAKIPLRVSGVNGGTEGDGPFARVMRLAKSMEGQVGVLSTNLFLVHPYLDLPEMGGAAVVLTDSDPVVASALADRIADAYWDCRAEFDPLTLSPAAAVQQGLAMQQRPVLLVEAADCCGGGAAGDSVHTLRALLAHAPHAISLVPVVDPEAATACHRAGLGASVTLSVGHRIDPQWGEPLTVIGQVLELTDGWFTYAGGFWDGQRTCMGPSAVLSIGGVRLLIASRPTYEWGDEQFRSMGLDPASATFIVAKNPMNYHRTYPAEVAAHALVLNTPGPTPAVPSHLPHRHPLPPRSKEPAMPPSAPLHQWLSRARTALRAGTLTEADLDALASLDVAAASASDATAPTRQHLLYLHASTPHIRSQVIASDYVNPDDDRPLDIDVEPVFPYDSVFQALRDGWQIIHFPDQRASFDDREIDILGYEFILQKMEPAK